MGGAWLHRGRNSREILGVGMCAAGWGPASGYQTTAAASEKDFRISSPGWGDEIGTDGLVLGGASGDELDSADVRRGTPAHATVLMTSRQGPKYLPTLEAVESLAPGASGELNSEVRADVVFLETARGGAVFSVGSMCWAGAMAVNQYENPVATLSTRVLHRFLQRAAESQGKI